MRAYGLKDRDFSHQCVDRVMAAINAVRAPAPPMIGEVLWMSAPTAFTLPGQYCYLSRRFVERCTSDAPAAFALAHEMAHHDLGHLRHAEMWAANTAAHAPLRLAALVLHNLVQRTYSREMELAADTYAIDLCQKAGYDLHECLRAFDILSWYLLDYGDVDGVYGSDDELTLDPRQAAGPLNWVYIEARLWLTRHRRSHPAIAERRRTLLAVIVKSPAPAA
jgi:predicted Zn-dependent protease